MTIPADEAMRKAARAVYGLFIDRPYVDAMPIVETVIRALDVAGWQCVPKVAAIESCSPFNVEFPYYTYAGTIGRETVAKEVNKWLDAAPKLIEVTP